MKKLNLLLMLSTMISFQLINAGFLEQLGQIIKELGNQAYSNVNNKQVGSKTLTCEELKNLEPYWNEKEAIDEYLKNAHEATKLRPGMPIISTYRLKLQEAEEKAAQLQKELDNAKKECGITR